MNYRVWIEINITHSYFPGGRSGVELHPTAETVILLHRMGVILRKKDPKSWILIKDTEQLRRFITKENEEPYRFRFLIKPSSPEIEYVTAWKEQKSDCWEIACEKRIKDEWVLQITPELREDEENVIHIDPVLENRAFIWEFILIPKYGNHNRIVDLREERGRITFEKMEQTDFLDEGIVFKCTTKDAIPLKERYDYRIRLWEKKENGEVLLSSNVPVPKPDIRSATQPKERICTYFYF